MSKSSAQQSQRTNRVPYEPREAARSADPRQQRGTAGRGGFGSGYTFAHAGRQVRLGPVAFWIGVGSVVILAGWSVVTATYFAFSDDVIKGLIARATEQQYAYEDRIAELRAQIDRTTSRQLLDQEQFEQKLSELLRRQTTLESRATALSGIADPVTTGSLRSSASPVEPAKAAPIGSSLLAPHPLDRGTYLEPERAPASRKPGKEADIAGKRRWNRAPARSAAFPIRRPPARYARPATSRPPNRRRPATHC